jgi:ribosomal protein L29
MKFSDLLKKDTRDLSQMCTDLKKEYMNLRIMSKTAQDTKTSAIRLCKRNIARVKTRLSQMKTKQ